MGMYTGPACCANPFATTLSSASELESIRDKLLPPYDSIHCSQLPGSADDAHVRGEHNAFAASCHFAMGADFALTNTIPATSPTSMLARFSRFQGTLKAIRPMMATGILFSDPTKL